MPPVKQISAEELADAIDAGADFTLVDTRPEESYDAWHVEGAENLPFDPDEELDRERRERVDALVDGGPVVAICGKGISSMAFGLALGERGYDDVTVVRGGMEAWSKVYETAEIATRRDDLRIVQVQRRAKGCLGYVVGSASTGDAVVVDPTRQTDAFKVAAQEAGLTIERVLDTHVHADHISGGRALADELGVPYHLGESAGERGIEYDYRPLADGETIDLGDVEIEALHTPGHTSEMTSYRVGDEAIMTGDALFVESVGRTELQFGDDDAERGARLLYGSLHDVILELPDDVTVLPGHVTVTSDGRYAKDSPGEPIAARLGDLRRELDLLGLDEESFVRRLASDPPEKPPNYETVIDINEGRRAPEDESEATELELGPNNCSA